LKGPADKPEELGLEMGAYVLQNGGKEVLEAIKREQNS